MAIRSLTRSFNGGEVASAMFARIDDAKYQTGLAKCKNFLIEPQGPIINRPGFEFVSEVKYHDKRTRLISFSFSDTQTMVLEFGEKYIRFHSQGKTLMNDAGEIYEIATPYSHEHVFEIHYVQSADVVTLAHPSYPPMELRRYSAIDWRLVEVSLSPRLIAPANLRCQQFISNDATHKTGYQREYAVTALLSGGLQESTRSASVKIDCNPYGDGAYNLITWDEVEAADLYRVYRNQGGVWSFIGQTTELEIRDENLAPDASITPPIYDDAFRLERGIESIKVIYGGLGYKDATTMINGLDLDNATAVARHWDGESWVIDYEDKPYNSLEWPIEINRQPGYAYDVRCVVEDESGEGAIVVPVIDSVPSKDGDYADWRLFGFKIVNAGSGYVNPIVTCYVEGRSEHAGEKWVKRFTIPFTLHKEPIKHELRAVASSGIGFDGYALSTRGAISEVVIRNPGTGYESPVITVASACKAAAEFTITVGNVGDYPGAVTYFEQRRWFGGTLNRPNHLWATKSGTESDMSYALPSQEADRIAVRVAARESSRIQHLVPVSHLMLLTGAAEWRVSPMNSDAITPYSMSVRPQTYVGANSVQPIVINNAMIYAASRGGHLRECGYNYQVGGFSSSDICLRATHLFDNKEIIDLAFAKAPWPIIWSVSSAGNLVALTYIPEQQVGAFSTVETKGKFKSCCVVAEGDEDILYCVVERTINGQTRQFVERMHEREYVDLKNSIFVDAAGVYHGAAKTEIGGLTWLEGEEVAILADGSVEPRQVVKDGKIKLAFPASDVLIGLPYECDMQTLPVALSLQDGSFGSGHKKNVHKVFFRVVNSSGVKAGATFNRLTSYAPRSIEFAGSPPDPVNGELGFSIGAAWTNSGQVCVRQDLPLPLRIVSMTIDFELS